MPIDRLQVPNDSQSVFAFQSFGSFSMLSEVTNLPVWECAKQAFGEHNEKQVARWVKTTENYLFDGNIKQVAKRIRKLRKVNPSFRDEFETQANYFHKHEHRMQYRTFRQKAYHIGSGIVESVPKIGMVAERCKQAGMKWEKKGIDAILNWRCLLKNNSWERYWRSSPKAA